MLNYSTARKLTVGSGVVPGVGLGVGTGTGNVGNGVDAVGTPGVAVGGSGRITSSVGARVWFVPAWAKAIDARRTTSFIIIS